VLLLTVDHHFFAICIYNNLFVFLEFPRKKFVCKHIFKLCLNNTAKRSCTIHIVKSCFCKMRNSGICYMCYTKTLIKSDIYIKKTRGDRTCEHDHSPLVFLTYRKFRFFCSRDEMKIKFGSRIGCRHCLLFYFSQKSISIIVLLPLAVLSKEIFVCKLRFVAKMVSAVAAVCI